MGNVIIIDERGNNITDTISYLQEEIEKLKKENEKLYVHVQKLEQEINVSNKKIDYNQKTIIQIQAEEIEQTRTLWSSIVEIIKGTTKKKSNLKETKVKLD